MIVFSERQLHNRGEGELLYHKFSQ